MQARHRNEPMQTGRPQQHPDAVSVVVLVAGGYGAVGGLVSRALAEETGFKVVVAGRGADKAARMTAEIGGEGRRLDLDDPATWETAFQGVDCVVMCMDQHSTRLVEFVFARGIHYIDITASDCRRTAGAGALGRPAFGRPGAGIDQSPSCALRRPAGTR